MKNSQFKTPLVQSAAILGGVILLLAILASSTSTSEAGGPGFFSAIASIIAFLIGLVLSLAVSIAILIAVFLAAVSMVDSANAKKMYADLKINLTRQVNSFKSWASNSTANV